MRDVLVDSGAELLAVLGYALASVALTVAGAVLETAGLRDLLGGGDATLGAWLAFVGLVGLAAGLHLARDQVLPRAAAMR